METSYLRRPIPLGMILLLALMLHGPLLMMQLPLTQSYDANFHVFFASHYAQHWFDPWNEKWFAGFSQTTYPPLGHQWVALLSYVVGLNMGLMLVQLAAVLLLVVGVYRFARLWVDERGASYAALFSAFIGVLSFLVYSAGQLPTTLSAALYFLALPYLYAWSRDGNGRSLLKGVVFTLVAAAVHHVTLIFGAPILAIPVIWLACLDRKDGNSIGGVISRSAVFAVLAGVGVGLVLLPYWISIIQHPIEQVPIPHASRSNLLMNATYLMNYFIVPYGAMILALPFIVWLGSKTRRLRPLLLGFWVAFLFGLGGTTPFPKWILGRAFEILTFERFSLLAVVLALPILGELAAIAIDRYQAKAAVTIALATIFTTGLAFAWMAYTPFHTNADLNVDPVISFLNRDNHNKYRYLTLGFGNSVPKIATYADADSVDGEYNSARLLPEMTKFGAAQLSSAKFFGTAGMESLRAMLKHANRYGLKYAFVHDPYYNPLLAFAGWRPTETYDSGSVTVWVKDDVPPAHPIPSDAIPAPWEGLLWGTLPIGFSFLSIVLAFLLPDPAYSEERVVEFPSLAGEGVYVRGTR